MIGKRSRVFLASLDVKALPGSEMQRQQAGIGGFVYCMIPTCNEAQAEFRLRQALDEDRYELVELEFIRPAEEVDWENHEHEDAFEQLEQEARAEDDVVYSEFWSYGALVS